MTSLADCDIKHEKDLLSVMEIKNEPEGNEYGAEIEATEGCDNIFEPVVIKEEFEYTSLYFPNNGTISEVEGTQEILDKSLDDCEKNLQEEQNSREGDKTDVSFINDPYETCGTDLQEQKYGSFVGMKANICTKCNCTYFLPSNPNICKQIPHKCFNCNICNKSFSEKFNLIRHIRTHTNDKPFKCNICSRSFSGKFDLSRHIRTHTNEKPFKCNVCCRLFSDKSHLIRHMRTHTNDKPFECNVCSKSFSRKSHLTRHIRIHTNEKPFECNVCSRSFSQKSNLCLHMRTHTMKNRKI